MKRLRLLLAPLVVCLGLIAQPAAAAPFTYPPPLLQAYPAPDAPEVSAASWILYDDTAGMVIAEHNADDERAMASVTKIMTGLLALENSDMSEMVEISNRAAATGEKEIDLVAGESVPMDALFKALLIHSANDAATAIAEHVSGSVEAFVDLMNQRARELGLTHTHFANPHGLDAPGHYTSARDLVVLAREAMSHPEFADVVRAKTLVFPPAPDGTLRIGTSTNLLLNWYPGTIGVKTGFTNHALLTMVAAAERDGHRVYAVVLGSEGVRGHFADVTRLFDYVFQDLHYYGYAAGGEPYVAQMRHSDPGPLVAMSNLETYLHLAGQGLMLDRPTPLVESDQPSLPAITEVERDADSAPQSVFEAMGFWMTHMFGTG
ncbi:MAG: D-alanyl-D-alanine carboxypeptidase family protein [Acidimicrobiia bacterium]